MNAFTLFGELKADTRNFETALMRADKEIKDTEKNLDRLERKAKTFGQTSAVTARSHEKFAETLNASKKRMNDAVQAFDAGQISHRKMAGVLTQTDAKMAALNSRFRDSEARYRDSISGLAGLGQAFAVAGAAASLFTIKATADFQALKNQLTAATGSADGAARKLAELKQLSLANVGVDVNSAAFAFGQLKANTNLADESINKLIRSFGLLKTANPVMDTQQYTRNLQQLFNQGFEGIDWKEAIGNNARFAAQVKAAFGTDNPEVLRSMKESGKLSAEQWYNGIADATLADEKINKLTEQPISRIQKAWANLKIDLGQFGDTLTQDLEAEINKATKAMGERDLGGFMEALGLAVGRKFVEGFSSGVSDPAAMLKGAAMALTGFSRGVVQSIVNGFDMNAVSAFLGKIANMMTLASQIAISGSLAIIRGIQSAWSAGLGRLATALFTGGVQAMVGLINGIRSKLSEATGVVAEVAAGVANAARAALKIQSPSKVFFAIGQDTAQGFIDGIASMRASTQSAMASVLDVTGLKLGKTDKAGVEMLTQLTGSIAKFNAESNIQQTMLDLTAGKYAKLNPLVRERIILAAQELDRLELVKDGMSQLQDAFGKFIDEYIPEKTKLEELNDILAGPAVQAAIASMTDKYTAMYVALMRLNAVSADMAESFGGAIPERTSIGGTGLGSQETPTPEAVALPPKVKADWVDFWDTLQQRMRQFRSELPSFKQALGENLVSSIEGLANTFGNMFASFDGTMKSLWSSLIQGLRQTVSQIIGELMRLAAMKLITSLFGSLAGGLGGAAQSGFGNATSALGMLRFADGGFVSGGGTSTSDSIPARLSNGEFVMSAKAVRNWGRSFFENLNAGFPSPLAMAGGGMVSSFGGSSSVFNNQRTSTNNFHINVQGGGNPQQTGKQIAREAMNAMRREEMRNS